MSVALIGPNESHRKVVAKALAGSSARAFTEFTDYPSRLADLPQIVAQGFSVVMIDVDSDESYALQLIENFASFGSLVVMAYSQRNDPDLLMCCMRAGAREFLPLPGQAPPLSEPVEQAKGPEAEHPQQEVMHPGPSPVAPVEPRPEPLHVPVDGRPANGPSLVYSNSVRQPETPSLIPQDAGSPRAAQMDVEEAIPEAPAAPPAIEEAAKPKSDFDAWDSAHLRLKQSVDVQPGEARHRSASPRELFARSPKVVPSVVPRIDPPAEAKEAGAGEQAKLAEQARVPDAAGRPSIPPDMLARGSRERQSATARVAPPVTVRSGEPVAASAEDAPLPPEMFLRDPSKPSLTSAGPIDLFEQPVRKVYRPSPEDLSFSTLATDADAEKSRGGGMVWAFLAAGAGMIGALAFLVFFMHPGRPATTGVTATPPATPAAVSAPVAQTQPAPAAASASAPSQAGTQQPSDVFDQEFAAPTPGLRKPSPSQEAGQGGDGDGAPVSNPVSSNMMNQQLAAESKLPSNIKKPAPAEAPPPAGFSPVAIENGSSVAGAAFSSQSAKVVPAGAAISAGVAEGMLIRRVPPIYPPIAKSAGVSGTVVLDATITKTGTIANLRVISGPKMLQEAAVQAVKGWRYRPYMLNNEPVSVDTTIKVVFDLGR